MKIYIAGPDVFEQDYIEIGKKYSKLCEVYGHVGLYPLDNIVDFNQAKQKIAQDIFHANVELIKDADIVIANLNTFRGKEADSGTVWECGFASALGKKVYAYMDNTSPYIDSFNKVTKLSDGLYVDEDGKVIEDFEYPINLMIACSAEIVAGGFEDALKLI
ncbi:nucleoside 2-deoxyribosyltransferase [Sulfurimonas sp.]|uniref:nucleoside 2-deoxyribosyltransferase n=1 Tax=Sulfurimonas sp. TaxID=2022749 RepID=UPI0025ECFEC6|nr:nucleoside 2-deoxyribosyltransferase [Sulfurimonas sp.]